MPREQRLIILDYTETYRAILALSVQDGRPRPRGGSISGVALKAGDDKSMTITFTNKMSGRSAKCEYSRDFLAEALISYCKKCRIPLPRKRSRKSIEPWSEGLMLRITM